MTVNASLLAVVIQEMPSIIEQIKAAFVKAQPPAPTDADVIEAFNAAYQASLAKDEAWLAAHPPDVG